ncbi:hypothetical protein RB195_004415 [Necator americanus]|uniref:Uncharacterized protein n=1 Tax=Necator americanus TaxID=51031 RepID=A0ABR1BHW0_NECAM
MSIRLWSSTTDSLNQPLSSCRLVFGAQPSAKIASSRYVIGGVCVCAEQEDHGGGDSLGWISSVQPASQPNLNESITCEHSSYVRIVDVRTGSMSLTVRSSLEFG